MYLAEIWRYPVKSMAGERLERVTLGLAGIEDDRTIHVENRRGRVVTARTHPQLLRHRAVTTGHGNTVVDGLSWAHPEIAAAIEKDVGPGALLVPDESLDRFDILPLLVATDGAIKEFAHDGRRLRPNLVIGGVSGLEERSWPGKRPNQLPCCPVRRASILQKLETIVSVLFSWSILILVVYQMSLVPHARPAVRVEKK